jgi:hypothetical protein
MSDGAPLGHLRAQLVHMRNELVERLAERVTGDKAGAAWLGRRGAPRQSMK